VIKRQDIGLGTTGEEEKKWFASEIELAYAADVKAKPGLKSRQQKA
jgi:hypothetical protein